jgi:hypothetical protein
LKKLIFVVGRRNMLFNMKSKAFESLILRRNGEFWLSHNGEGMRTSTLIVTVL